MRRLTVQRLPPQLVLPEKVDQNTFDGKIEHAKEKRGGEREIDGGRGRKKETKRERERERERVKVKEESGKERESEGKREEWERE